MNYVKKATAFLMTVFMVICPLTVSGAEESPKKLTVEKALSMALTSNTEYRNLLDEEESFKTTREDLLSNYYRVHAPNEVQVVLDKIEQHDFNVSMFERKVENKKLSVKDSVIQCFIKVISAEKKLELHDMTLKNAYADLKIAETKAKLAIITQTAYEASKIDYEKKSVTDRQTKVNAVDSAYNELNKLINQPLESRYILELDYEYNEFLDDNIKNKVSNTIENSINIITKQVDYEKALKKIDQYYYYPDETVSSLRTKAEQSLRALNDAKAQLEQTVINEYTAIKSLEAQYAENVIELENMKKQHAIKEVQFGLGKTTSLEISKSKLTILELEETIRSLVIDHEYEVFRFNNPVLLEK